MLATLASSGSVEFDPILDAFGTRGMKIETLPLPQSLLPILGMETVAVTLVPTVITLYRPDASLARRVSQDLERLARHGQFTLGIDRRGIIRVTPLPGKPLKPPPEPHEEKALLMAGLPRYNNLVAWPLYKALDATIVSRLYRCAGIFRFYGYFRARIILHREARGGWL